MENNNTKPHAIMFALPFQGHVTPSTHLAIILASKGFTITFVNTEYIHHQIIKSSQPNYSTGDGDGRGDDDVFTKARNSGLDIRYKTITDGFPLDFNRALNQAQIFEKNYVGFPAHVDELVGNLVKSDPSISCLIVDTFYTWTSQVAQKYNLVHISFWTETALVFNLYYHADLLNNNGHLASHDMGTIDYIPGVKAIERKDLPSFLQEREKRICDYLDKVFKEVKNADFILCNTIQELESDTILALQEKLPIYAISTLKLSPFGLSEIAIPTSMRTEFNCSQWLNTKPQGSVCYVSFGSFLPSKKSDIEEIAHGLVLSGVNFLWVLRHDAVSSDQEPYVLPNELQDEIKDKGLVVTWTNQIEVISHPSIGGFLTHCGWNSILESIQYSGVPLLCFPLKGDQITNRKSVVDDWRIGLNLCDTKPLTRLEVAEKIKCLIDGESKGDELREQVIKVRQTVGHALAKDGSCEKNLDKFVVDVKAKIGERSI